MKKCLHTLLIIFIWLFLADFSFAFLGTTPKIDEKHISNDLDRKVIQDWPFKKKHPHRIKILDAKYEKDNAVVYVSIKIINLSGDAGRSGKLRLAYEFAADDWNLLEIKSISFTVINDINERLIIKQTNGYPLLIAVDEGNIEDVKLLIADGADVNIESDNNRSWSPLRLAASKGHLEIVKILIDRGAIINDANRLNDSTALLEASSNGHYNIVKLLISKGVNINFRNAGGWTGIMGATFSKEPASIVKLLLNNGADVNIKNNDGNTVLDLAKSQNNLEVVSLLEKAGTKE